MRDDKCTESLSSLTILAPKIAENRGSLRDNRATRIAFIHRVLVWAIRVVVGIFHCGSFHCGCRSSVNRHASTIDRIRADVQSSIARFQDCGCAVDNGGEWRNAIEGHRCRSMADQQPIADQLFRGRQLLIADLEVFVSIARPITLMASDCQ